MLMTFVSVLTVTMLFKCWGQQSEEFMVLGDIICVYAHTFHFSHFTNLYYLQCLDCRWFYTFGEGVVPNTVILRLALRL